jgi:hypothetical protein
MIMTDNMTDNEINGKIALVLGGWTLERVSGVNSNGTSESDELWFPPDCDEETRAAKISDFQDAISAGTWTGDTPPPYTTNLELAMSLVPDGWAIERLTYWPSAPEEGDFKEISHVALWQMSYGDWHKGKRIWSHGRGDHRVEAEASTPAYALSIAAYRARHLLGEWDMLLVPNMNESGVSP